MIFFSTDSESESDEEGVFYSTLEGSKRQQKPGDPSGQSKVTATLIIGQGVLNVFTNIRVCIYWISRMHMSLHTNLYNISNKVPTTQDTVSSYCGIFMSYMNSFLASVDVVH